MTRVSHAAPAHHLGDTRGLLTAVAAEGYCLFAAALRDETSARAAFHGLATLYLIGALPPELGDDPGQIARSVPGQFPP